MEKQLPELLEHQLCIVKSGQAPTSINGSTQEDGNGYGSLQKVLLIPLGRHFVIVAGFGPRPACVISSHPLTHSELFETVLSFWPEGLIKAIYSVPASNCLCQKMLRASKYPTLTVLKAWCLLIQGVEYYQSLENQHYFTHHCTYQ